MSDQLGIVLIGGRRALADRLCAELDLEHLTAGDLPRERATTSGRGYVTADGILPEALVIGMARLADRPRFLLDGFPQTLAQAHALTYVLRLAGRQLRAAVCCDGAADSAVVRYYEALGLLERVGDSPSGQVSVNL